MEKGINQHPQGDHLAAQPCVLPRAGKSRLNPTYCIAAICRGVRVDICWADPAAGEEAPPTVEPAFDALPPVRQAAALRVVGKKRQRSGQIVRAVAALARDDTGFPMLGVGKSAVLPVVPGRHVGLGTLTHQRPLKMGLENVVFPNIMLGGIDVEEVQQLSGNPTVDYVGDSRRAVRSQIALLADATEQPRAALIEVAPGPLVLERPEHGQRSDIAAGNEIRLADEGVARRIGGNPPCIAVIEEAPRAHG
jgi:hypothetical protein